MQSTAEKVEAARSIIKDINEKHKQIKTYLFEKIDSVEIYNRDGIVLTYQKGKIHYKFTQMEDSNFILNLIKIMTKKANFFEYCEFRNPDYVDIQGHPYRKDVFEFYEKVCKVFKAMQEAGLYAKSIS